MTTPLIPGDAAPWFRGEAVGGTPDYGFDTVAGLPVVMLILGSGRWAPSPAALAVLAANRALFDDRRARFFGVSTDADDVDSGRIARELPGIRWFIDRDAAISRLYGALSTDGGVQRYQPHWLLLDRSLRVVERADIVDGAAIMARLRTLLDTAEDAPTAPVLVVPRVFDDATCRDLIALYERHGGIPSGFMREVDGRTVGRMDPRFKRRSDHVIKDETLRQPLRARLVRFLLPQIRRAFQFEATRVERWLVACYDGSNGGHFRAHRDNTTKGTAHRKFACTINLNAGDYDGGDLRFPEYGDRTYRAPTGGAVVFSCSLLHEALPVTAGRRYAFLPFLYDEAGARLREENARFMSDDLGRYRADRADARS